MAILRSDRYRMIEWTVCVLLFIYLSIPQTVTLPNGRVPAYDPLCNIGFAPERFMPVFWDCSGFINCDPTPLGRYEAIWENCPPQLVFSSRGRNCVTSSYCPDGKAASVSFCQSGSTPNLAFKHPDSCAMYYQCNTTKPNSNLRVYENECDLGMLFDEKDGKCIDKRLVDCGDRPLPQGTCGYRKLCKLPSCRGLPNGYYPLEEAPFTAEYFECISEEFIAVRRCTEASEIFDPSLRRCTRGVLPGKDFTT
ncbi:hypothetical protein LOTGIDRAFT_160173 [Lottia gigantea]|uniref:Chitin-binding type-2 domain-containing protein n=1 Tax=Lottia gigantea TaxID=225164 RepID=V4AN30_LOTGI|nr:hypothetical protein LOTGIDRAFT_160173 [Lottia gigantea]ESO96185.1 hypothetical protein LOTGIDRAFT_160173 [Lottia gigantea]